MKIYKKQMIHKSLFVIQCPTCYNYVASASEKMYLPDWSTCDECDNTN